MKACEEQAHTHKTEQLNHKVPCGFNLNRTLAKKTPPDSEQKQHARAHRLQTLRGLVGQATPLPPRTCPAHFFCEYTVSITLEQAPGGRRREVEGTGDRDAGRLILLLAVPVRAAVVDGPVAATHTCRTMTAMTSQARRAGGRWCRAGPQDAAPDPAATPGAWSMTGLGPVHSGLSAVSRR